MDAVVWDRFLFGFTITYHYLFPQLTMGLALLIVIFKVLRLRTHNPAYDEVARFWAKIFGVNFAVGVVTGIPMEFQFGTNWARFSDFAGGVIGLTLALIPLSFHAFNDAEFGSRLPLLGDIDVAIHEFGHMFFGPFGWES